MLSFVLSALALGAVQDLPAAPTRPSLMCSEHLTNARGMRNCLSGLLDDAERDLDAAADAARAEAADADAETGGMFQAEALFDTAQASWSAYRDTECRRRAALMILSADAREAQELDCRIVLTRARATELREQ